MERNVVPVAEIFGLKVAHFIAGVAGGIVRAFLGSGSWMSAMAAVIVGSLTAGYLTAPAHTLLVYYFPRLKPDQTLEHSVGFVVGLTAMFICEGFIVATKKWSRAPRIPPGNI